MAVVADLQIASAPAAVQLGRLLAQLHLGLGNIVSQEPGAKTRTEIEHALLDGELPGGITHRRQDRAGVGVKLDRGLATGIEPLSGAFHDGAYRNRDAKTR